MPQTPTFTKEIVEAAIEGLEARRQRNDEQIAELPAMVPAGTSSTTERSKKRGRPGRLSAEGRAAIAGAQRRRWAKKAGDRGSAASSQKAAPRKRRLSAAGRKA